MSNCCIEKAKEFITCVLCNSGLDYLELADK